MGGEYNDLLDTSFAKPANKPLSKPEPKKEEAPLLLGPATVYAHNAWAMVRGVNLQTGKLVWTSLYKKGARLLGVEASAKTKGRRARRTREKDERSKGARGVSSSSTRTVALTRLE